MTDTIPQQNQANQDPTKPQLNIPDNVPTKTPCLDKGFVYLVDKMGTDSSIVQAARVSYGAGTKTVSDDASLIRYLMRQKHTTPFEMCQLKFHVKCPLFVAQQWLRHRTASVNQASARFSVMVDEFHMPSSWREQSQSNKQGSGEDLDELIQIASTAEATDVFNNCYDAYEKLLERNVAREQGRILLPVSLYTEFYWCVNLHNFFNFVRLRSDKHAQEEIRVYSDAMLEICKEHYPIATKAFFDYVISSVTFTGPEIKALSTGISDELSNREKKELEEKLKKFGEFGEFGKFCKSKEASEPNKELENKQSS
jgi:thymidylate synthase (FAD)